MKSIVFVLRLIFGAIFFFVFGLDGFFHFWPEPEISETGEVLLKALVESGYFFPVLNTVEMILGALLISGYFIPLCLVLLAPLTAQIFLFYIFLEPSGAPMSVFLIIVNIFLIYSYKNSLRGLFEPKTTI